MLEKTAQPCVATFRRKARLPKQMFGSSEIFKTQPCDYLQVSGHIVGIGAPEGEGLVWFGRKESGKNWRAGRLRPPGREKEQKAQKKLRHSVRPTKLPPVHGKTQLATFLSRMKLFAGQTL